MGQIECKNLIVGYEGKEVANNINFTLNEGDYLCIVGENGAGKSTLMKTLLGLIKPVGGELNFDKSIKKSDIGYLPQFTETQSDFPATSYEIVLSGFEGKKGLRPFYSKAEKLLACSFLNDLEILDLKNRSFKELSGGQKQRVLIARMLASKGKIIFLDEPSSSLDQNTINKMYEIINKLNKEEKVSIVMISHDLENVSKYASNILVVGKNNTTPTKNAFIKGGI